MTRSKATFAFVGTVVDECTCEHSPACSVAGNKFQLNLIRSLERVTGRPLDVISLRPVAMYPKGQGIIFTRASQRLGRTSTGWMIPFINLPIVKQVTVALAIFLHLFCWLVRHRSHPRVVLVYNLFSPLSLPVLAATALGGGKAVAIVAELPLDFYTFRGVRGIFERMDFWFQNFAIRRFAGLVPFTRQIAEDFAPGLPSLVMEGGVVSELGNPVTDAAIEGRPPPREAICLYSGSLHEINGIDLLLGAFKLVPGRQNRLWLFGSGPLEELVRRAAAQDPRIVYWGALPNSTVIERQRQATVLINPRPTSRSRLIRYSFPSKLLEYMMSGRPVVTTMLPGIPEEYYEFVYLLTDETPTGLARLIGEVCSRDPLELERRGKGARDFMLRNKNWTRQAERIRDFVSAL